MQEDLSDKIDEFEGSGPSGNTPIGFGNRVARFLPVSIRARLITLIALCFVPAGAVFLAAFLAVIHYDTERARAALDMRYPRAGVTPTSTPIRSSGSARP